MHYNENGGRPVALNKLGEEVTVVCFPKYKKGEVSVQRKKIKATYGKYSISKFVFSF